MVNPSIGKADGSKVVSQESEMWNIADGFTKIKILRLLIELDIHETIALFGRKDMEEFVPEESIPHKRVEAIHRMMFCLRQLIGNCKFSIDKKDKYAINNLIGRIDNVESVINGISYEITNDVTKEKLLRINESHFRKCFDILKDVKDELNIPINRAGLIFRMSEGVDLDAIMNSIIEGG